MQSFTRNTIYDTKQKLMKLALNIFETRSKILINSATPEILEMYNIQKLKLGFINNIEYLNLLTYDIVMFQVSLIIKGTKCFEAFSLDLNEKRRFKYTKETTQYTIQKNILAILNALYHEVIVKPYTKQHVIDQAVQNIRRNYLITKLIAGQNFTRQKLEEFLSLQQYKVFELSSNRYPELIQGLSSFDGRIVYIHQNFNYSDYSKDIYKEPDFEIKRISDELNSQPYLALIWLIEYQLMENLSRWSSNSHILSISPERNKNLRIENNQMVGSGNFYLSKAHKYKNKLYNPFQLNYKLRMIMNRCLIYDY